VIGWRDRANAWLLRLVIVVWNALLQWQRRDLVFSSLSAGFVR